jgi:hypothetical protein
MMWIQTSALSKKSKDGCLYDEHSRAVSQWSLLKVRSIFWGHIIQNLLIDTQKGSSIKKTYSFVIEYKC